MLIVWGERGFMALKKGFCGYSIKGGRFFKVYIIFPTISVENSSVYLYGRMTIID